MNKPNEHNERERRAAMPRIKKICRMREQGFSFVQIAKEFNISRQFAHQLWKRGQTL